VTSAITAPQIAPGVLLPAPATLAPGLELLGYDPAPAAHDPGTTLPLTLYWRAARALAADYQVSLVLRDAQGQVMTRQTRPASGSYGTAQWRPGEIVRGWQDLALPAALPQGDYRLEVGLDGPAQDLGALRITGRPHLFSPPAVASRQDLRVGQAFRFVGESLAAPRVQAGSALSLTLNWQGLAPADRSYTVFVHLLGPDGRIWAQQDHVPGDGALPTTTWLPGEYVTDSYRLAVQPGAPPGMYTLEIGMYDAASGQRLPITDPAGAPQGDRILLSTPVELIR
jgi:hypothetical protein